MQIFHKHIISNNMYVIEFDEICFALLCQSTQFHENAIRVQVAPHAKKEIAQIKIHDVQ